MFAKPARDLFAPTDKETQHSIVLINLITRCSAFN